MNEDTFDATSSQARAYRPSNRWASQSQNFTNSDELQRDLSDTHENHHDLHQDPLERALALDDEDISFPNLSSNRRVKAFSQTGSNPRGWREMDARMLRVEHHLTNLVANEERNTPIGLGVLQNEAPIASDPVSDALPNGIESEPFTSSTIKPGTVDRPWTELMNKVAGDSDFAIEVLDGDPSYYHPTKNAERLEKVELEASAGKDVQSVVACVKKTLNTAAQPVENMSVIPDRIRINSPFILNTLSGIDRHLDASGPAVMLRPYKFLVYHYDRIKDSVNLFERQLEKEDPESKDADTLRITISHMQCLVNFLDTCIVPTMTRLADNNTRKIAFRDLWYVFPPGEDIFMPLKRLRGSVFRDAMDATPETFTRRYNMLWRVTGTGGGRPNLAASQNHEDSLKPEPFQVHCYYVDFDGKFFLPTVHTFAILPFIGERDIASLDFYPVRFMRGGEEKLLEHTELGRDIFRTIATGFTHFYYAGLTMVTQPCGCPLQQEPMHQEYIESEVIVDFKATLLRHPSWRPKPTFWKAPPRVEGEFRERCPVRYWKDKARKHLINSEHDYIYDDYHIDKERALIFRSNEQIFSPIPSGWASNAEMVPQKDVGLLAGRAFAFVLRTRSFAPLWLWALQPIRSQSDSLNNLQLRDDTFKDTIFALVQSHFRQISQHSTEFEYDVVRGKGKGLIILLHGAPGVGKTSTAESVAAKSGRPLFQITCGDLGLTPGEVEKNLKEIYRFAKLWGCVLLLDECDIFLAQRTKNDIKRNGLVSVFLRTLEFFTGVLFLTTNRVGVLDDAIKSRLTWTAYYPPLDEKQTIKIWKVNIRLLRQRSPNLDIDVRGILRFALDHFRASLVTESIWNGRQIQNAFKVATALAEWDLHSQDEELKQEIGSLEGVREKRAKLTASQFRVIAQGTQAFDDYLRDTHGLNERERAYNALERNDDFELEENVAENRLPEEHHYHRQVSRSPELSHRRGSMSTYLPLQPAERPPASPHSLSPTARRKSSAATKWPSAVSPSASTGNLIPAVHHTRPRKQSSSLTTVYPAADLMAHSPRTNGIYSNRMQGSYRESADHSTLRETSYDNDNAELEMDEVMEANENAFTTSTSSLDALGDDL